MDGKPSQISKTDSSYVVRKGTIKDLPTVVRLAEHGADEVEIAGFDEDYVYLLTKKIQKNGVGVVLTYEDEVVGYIGGINGQHPYDPKFKILTTMSWYVKPQHRSKYALKLLQFYIEECKKTGTHLLRMQARFSKDPIKMTKLYERYGFVATEIAYEMEMN
jgi:L-amino acid N-acyltransferase YncA